MQENPIRRGDMLYIAKALDFTSDECCIFFDIPYSTWYRIRNGTYNGKLTVDQNSRIRYGVVMYNLLKKNNYNKYWLMNTGSIPEFPGSPFDNIKKSGLYFFYIIIFILSNRPSIKQNSSQG
jgi:hypothetical protein